ncbi:hypothetical protein K0G55_20705 [Bacteroides fragilis]|nr:hypothetical protein [Bacteroides fragilis]MCE9306931.1 hypothetical protein [Bacteroides fragilis]
MEKGKVGEGKIHIIILYRGNLSERGKRGFAEKGRRRSVCGEEIEEKIGNLTGGKQKIRRDCDKD